MKPEDRMEFERLQFELRPLFFLQEKLNGKIRRKFSKEHDEFLREEHQEKNIIAFKVEVAELLNAMKFHKYWTQDLPESRERILEEYVDGLHFLLTIGLDKDVKNYQYQGELREEYTFSDLSFLFDHLFMIPWKDLRKEEYKNGLELYLRIGEILGFTWEDIKTAYTKKNLENHERQDNGY